jgi:hypothetical protein
MDAQQKQHLDERRNMAKDQASSDLHKSLEDLLVEVHDESLHVPMDRPYEQTQVRTTARFASLVVRLANRTERLHRAVVILTWVLVFLTLVLVVLGYIAVRK